MADSLDLGLALKKDNFTMQFDGYVYIEKEGSYIFYSVSDDGLKVFFNNKLIINNDGLHAAQVPAAYMTPLKQGYYPIKIEYFEKGGDQSIVVGYQTGKNKPVVFSKKMLFHKE